MSGHETAPGAATNSTRGERPDSSANHAQSTAHPRDWQEVADLIEGTFVVLVITPQNRARRRCYLTLAAAQRAAERATDRGQFATVVLASVQPIAEVTA